MHSETLLIGRKSPLGVDIRQGSHFQRKLHVGIICGTFKENKSTGFTVRGRIQ